MKESTYLITIKKPNECSKEELQKFASLVCDGGEVTKMGLEERIQKAEALIFISRKACIEGIAALKNPEQKYKNSVFNKANATAQASEFSFELGLM